MSYVAYILKCSDGTLYCGSTTDLDKRLMQHNSSNAGAKYTRGRRPVELVYHTQAATLKEARALEAMYKRMTRSQKLILIATM
ncbi:MAG: hypothetical protein RI996_640 [Candidatus Parcubacteria bacterium]